MKTEKYITDNLCSYEASAILKVKRFNIPTTHFYNNLKELEYKIEDSGCNESEYYFDFESFLDNWNLANMKVEFKSGKYGVTTSAPPHHIAIAWIKEKFGIQLFPDYTYYDGFTYGYKWVKGNGSYGEIWKDNDMDAAGHDNLYDATDYAIIFTLNNLLS